MEAEKLDFSSPDCWVLVNHVDGQVWEWDTENSRWRRATDKQRLRKVADYVMQKILNMA